MRQSNLDRVAAVLDTAPAPLSYADISGIVGLSTNTVMLALAQLGAVPDHNWPRGWTKAPPPIDSVPSISTDPEQENVLVPQYDGVENWPERWGKSRVNVATGIGDLIIDRKTDPKVLADRFRNLASIAASLTLALDQVKDDPDWFDQLSGK